MNMYEASQNANVYCLSLDLICSSSVCVTLAGRNQSWLLLSSCLQWAFGFVLEIERVV